MSDIGSNAAAGASLGAALGSVVPGLGTVIGGAAGGVVGAAVGIAQETGLLGLFGKHLFGDNAPAVAEAVVQVASAVTGEEIPTAHDVAALDPVRRTELTVSLAQLAVQTEVARLADIADARKTMTNLAGSGSWTALGAPVVSFIVLVSFGVGLWGILMHTVPGESQGVANVMLGTLGSMATAVVSFWVGSSAGSQRKTDLLAAAPPVSLPP